MAQCQTNPEGRCTMEPPCPPGECYLGAVLAKEHATSAGPVVEDIGIARDLLRKELSYGRGPFTEEEPWERSGLAMVNAVLDTLIPGARLVVEINESTGEPVRVYLGRGKAWQRPRDLARTLRELADCLEYDSETRPE